MKYTGESIQMVYVSKTNNKIISEIPLGKPVELYYDSFYKSWQITYYDENKINQIFKLKYLQTTDGVCIMQDHLESTFIVVNSIGLYGVLFIKPLNIKLNEGVDGYYRINNVKRIE